jgi:hypothetical protein
MARDETLPSRVVVTSTPSATAQPTAIRCNPKIPPNHESAVNTMADDTEQQPGNAATHGVLNPADPDEIGFLVTLRADLSDQDADAAAQSIAEVPGVLAVRRYVADPSGRAAVELNDARWRESIVHLLDDEGV